MVASSDLRRALDTAAEVADVAGLPHQTHSGLREVNFGRAEGHTRGEMQELFPEALQAFLEAPATSPLPAGEHGAAAARRFLSAVHEIVKAVPSDGDVLIVAHTTIIRLALCQVMGLPLNEYRRRFPYVGNVALTTVELPEVATSEEWAARGGLIRFNTLVE